MLPTHWNMKFRAMGTLSMRDNPQLAKANIVATYLRIAKGDLDEARILIDQMPGSRGAAYHLEQAAEKIIRAITTSEDIRVGLGHELDDFVDEIPDSHPFKMRCRGIQDLKKYATTY